MIVLLCEDLERPGNGLNLREIEDWLAKRSPGVQIRRAPGPCDRPEGLLAPDLKGADRVVLGLCSVDGEGHELDARARKLGLDPGAIEAVNLGGYCARAHPEPQATAKAKLLLGAALVKARAYEGSRSENAKPVLSWDQKVSRRALFTLPPVRYEVVPSIREEACAAEEGCRVCAGLCPHEALRVGDDGRMVLNKQGCTGCGACVSACPRGAFQFPGASLHQIQAQVGALLDAIPLPPDRRAILFLCHKGISTLEGLAREGLSYPEDWLPVEVPCLGMVTPAWILGCLNQGAAAVGVLPCLPEKCRFGPREVVEGRVDYCRDLLEEMGGDPDSVRLLDPRDAGSLARSLADLSTPEVGDHAGHPLTEPGFGPWATAKAVLGLAQALGAPLDRTLAHPHSPLGVVEIQDGCTACGACARACPTGALSMEQDEKGVFVSFDAGICLACEGCAPVCPEKVVRVEKATDLGRLSRGRGDLYRGAAPRCVKCGAPVAPQAMLDRIGALLGDHPVLSTSTLTKYCLDCRKVL